MSLKSPRTKVSRQSRLRLASALPLLCALIFFCPALIPCQTLPHALTAKEASPGEAAELRTAHLTVFDDVWETIHERYYDQTFHGVDWTAQRIKFRNTAADAQSSAELYKILRQMIGALRDAHTRVYAPDEKFDWRHPRITSVGASVREIAGEAVVTNIERDSEAERAGLRAGDVILRINDEPARAIFEQRLREGIDSSTIRATRLRAMSGLFDGAAGTTLKVLWLADKGKEREAILRREQREREQVLRVRRVRAGFSVIKFDAFTESVIVDFAHRMNNSLHNAPGLIIDLRNNGGGEAEAMTEMASAFLHAGTSLGQFTDRNGRTAFEPHTRAAPLLTANKIPLFRAPVVVLTSERTSSAAEIFAAALKEANRAPVIGAQTCGCVLAIRRRHSLPDGGELDVSEMDYRTAYGARLEGTGVAPNQELAPAKQDLRARRDRTLERAIELLQFARRSQK